MGRVHYRPFCHNVHLTDNIMMYYRFVLFSLQYAMPLCIITCAYARMAHRLWGSRAPGNAEDTRDANIMRNKKKVGKFSYLFQERFNRGNLSFAFSLLKFSTYVMMEFFISVAFHIDAKKKEVSPIQYQFLIYE